MDNEPHINRGCQAVSPAGNATPTTLHHWMAPPRKWSSRQPTMSTFIRHQALQRRGIVMFLLSKFVMFFWANLIYGNIMLYMSLGLIVLLLLWTGNYIGYLRQSHLVLFPWSLLSNVGRSSLRGWSLSSSWFIVRMCKISQPHLGSLRPTSPHNRSK